MYSRQKVIDLAKSWIGKNERDGSFKVIVDTYNSLPTGKLPRGIKMSYDWAWCACTWSALAIKLGYTEIMPIEISCGELINRAKEMGVWVEDDAYVPKPGDAILYDWQDTGVGDNVGWPDHVGTVEKVVGSTITVIEGNKNESVERRQIQVNARYIRGYICPKYDEVDKATTGLKTLDEIAAEVIAMKWGTYPERKDRLVAAGYDYAAVQSLVNARLSAPAKHRIKVTASVLNIRSTPDSSSKSNIVGTYTRGEVVEIIDISGGWGRTRAGWIYLKYTTTV